MEHIALKITAFIFAVALWLYVMSLNTFKMQTDIPVRLVRLPEKLAIASKPPQNMTVTLEGAPFDLMRLRSRILHGDTSSAAIVIDLQNAELGATRIHLDEKNFMSPGFPGVKFVDPENKLLFIDLELDTRNVRTIPIHSQATFETAEGYILTDEPKLVPENISVSGARNVITRIIEISTDSIRFDSLTQDGKYEIKLDFKQIPSIIFPSDSSITIETKVQKLAKKTFRNLPVQLIGFYEKGAYKLNPDKLDVEITGGKTTLDSIKSEDIELLVEFNRFQIEDVDSLTPTVKMQLLNNINREKSIRATQLTPDKVSLQKIEVVPDTNKIAEEGNEDTEE